MTRPTLVSVFYGTFPTPHTRCYVVLFTDDDDSEPLLQQVKEANNPVLAPYVPEHPASPEHIGARMVTGGRLMQTSK